MARETLARNCQAAERQVDKSMRYFKNPVTRLFSTADDMMGTAHCVPCTGVIGKHLVGLVGFLVGWLVGWLVGGFIGALVLWLIGSLVHYLVGWLVGSLRLVG